MPWDQASFRKHNRALSPGQSAHAARIANAILKRTGDEGLAIATANARVKKRAAGGGVGQSDPMQAAFDAIAAARTGAQQYAQGVFGTGTPSGQSPAGGGGVSQSDAIQAGYDAIAAAHAGAQQYARDVFAPPGGSSGQSPAGQSPAGPLPQAPSYLAGTAGSPVNLANLPRYSPQVPSDMGINSAGFMNTPQTGDFSLDPMTGALTPGTQAALRTLAQRGLNIGGQQAGASRQCAAVWTSRATRERAGGRGERRGRRRQCGGRGWQPIGGRYHRRPGTVVWLFWHWSKDRRRDWLCLGARTIGFVGGGGHRRRNWGI
jgi:hypothetical protein